MKVYLIKILNVMNDIRLLAKHYYTPYLVIYILTGIIAVLMLIQQCQEPIQNSKFFVRATFTILFCVIGTRVVRHFDHERKKKKHLKDVANRKNHKSSNHP